MTRLTVQVFTHLPMEINMRESIKMERNTVQVFTHGILIHGKDKNMRDSLKMAKCTVEVFGHIQVEQNMRKSLKMEKMKRWCGAFKNK